MTKGQYKEDKYKGLNPDIEEFRAFYFKNLFSPMIRDQSLCEFLGLTLPEYQSIMNNKEKI